MERRTFLALGAAAVGLAGCTRQSPKPRPPSAPTTPTTADDPDASLRAEVAASEGALIAAYRTAIAADPQLASDLEPFLAHHEEHLARIAPGYAPGDAPEKSPGASTPLTESPAGAASTPPAATRPVPASGSSLPAPSTSAPTAAASGSGPSEDASSSGAAEGQDAPASPPSTAEVLTELAAAESAGQAQRTTACDGAQDPALARDLCLIAASEAQHAAALEGLSAQGSRAAQGSESAEVTDP